VRRAVGVLVQLGIRRSASRRGAASTCDGALPGCETASVFSQAIAAGWAVGGAYLWRLSTDLDPSRTVFEQTNGEYYVVTIRGDASESNGSNNSCGITGGLSACPSKRVRAIQSSLSRGDEGKNNRFENREAPKARTLATPTRQDRRKRTRALRPPGRA